MDNYHTTADCGCSQNRQQRPMPEKPCREPMPCHPMAQKPCPADIPGRPMAQKPCPAPMPRCRWYKNPAQLPCLGGRWRRSLARQTSLGAQCQPALPLLRAALTNQTHWQACQLGWHMSHGNFSGKHLTWIKRCSAALFSLN